MMLETLLSNPWFWAFLAAIGWCLGFGVVGSRSLGSNLGFGITMFMLAELPRFLLPLPFVTQPRFGSGSPWLVGVGIIILVASLLFGSSAFRIMPLTGPHQEEPLRTDGFYAIVRHPLMLCDIFWPLGWSLIYGSLIGIALTPVWWLVIWTLTYVEEESLIREYGDAYREYRTRVPRLLPRLIRFERRRNNG
jgi:protein-S-isoprenylcysteine O-methyltransferase Ste14